MIKMAIREIDKFYRELDAEYKYFVRNSWAAVKVEGFNQKKKLQQEIKQGAPGGQRLVPLTWIARVLREKKYGSLRLEPNVHGRPATMDILGKTSDWPPLYRTFHGIRYHTTYPGDKMNFQFGFGTIFSSTSWKRLARMQQEGFTTPVTNQLRMKFAAFGVPLSSKTTTLVTPPRDIITSFWEKHQSEAWRNIQDNFERKCRGERI